MRKRIMSLMFLVILAICMSFPVSAKPAKPTTEYPVYGMTEADLSPINDYVSALYDNGIYLTIPDLTVANKDEYDWIYTKIGESNYLTYIWYYDGSKDSLSAEFPVSFSSRDEAMKVLMMSMLSVGKITADEYLTDLKDNISGEWAELEVEDDIISYYEDEDLCSITVERFFDNSVGTTDSISETSSNDIEASVTLKEQDEFTAAVKRTVQNRLKEYWNVSLEDISLVLDDSRNVETMGIHFKWNVENGEEKTKQMLEMYSDDMAATIQETYPDTVFQEVYIFWKVPYIHKSWNVAKYKYSSRDDKIYHIDSLGLLYGKD